MTDDVLKPDLWAPRSVTETRAIYADWADSYDVDVMGAGYATPTRLAQALRDHIAADDRILDFGCGTGLSGKALTHAGFTDVHGTDISPEMLDHAQNAGVYAQLWQSEPGTIDTRHGPYAAIVAAGVISLGAAPPETFETLIGALPAGGLLAFSFNDPTLTDGSYDAYLDGLIAAGKLSVLHRANGPHLPAKDMGSDIIIARVT